MEDLLISTLESFGYPVRLQGSLLPDEDYPDHFFTFWNSDSSSDGFFDNVETKCIYQYAINFYSVNPEYVYTKLHAAIVALKEVGFIISGDGHSVASDKSTHDGRGFIARYVKHL